MKIGERDAQILQSMHKYCRQIDDTIHLFGNEKDIFLGNHVYRNACAMALQTIGELAKKFSDEFMKECEKRKEDARIPWKEIKGMRAIIAHDYHDGIDFMRVWETIQNGVPSLERFCRETLEENDFELIKIKEVAGNTKFHV